VFARIYSSLNPTFGSIHVWTEDLVSGTNTRELDNIVEINLSRIFFDKGLTLLL
jgi:hypothetical protein